MYRVLTSERLWRVYFSNLQRTLNYECVYKVEVEGFSEIKFTEQY